MAERKPLSIKELFKLPVGSSFLVYWAKDGDAINALRLNYTRQFVGSNDSLTITTVDGYEWYWEKVAGVEDVNVASIADKLDELCEPLTSKDLWSPQEIAAAFRLLADRWNNE
jgi:hypothetical protein